jgi:hypothetical protein
VTSTRLPTRQAAPAPPATQPEVLRPAGSRLRTAVAASVAPLAVYATLTALRLAALYAQLPHHRGLRAALTSWDGAAYLDVAEHGYPHHIIWGNGPALIGSRAAFFPAYPATIRALHWLGAPIGLSWDRASVAAAVLAGAVAAVLIHRLGTALHSPAVGLVLVVLVFAQPLSVVYTMAYSEGPFLAFAAGTLLALRHGRWLTAGALCFAAGMTRPPGLAVAAAVAVAAAMWLWRHPRAGGHGGRWRPVVATLVGGSAVPLWWVYVGLRLGRADAWFAIQRQAWHTRFDGGRATMAVTAGLLRQPITWTDLGMLLLLAIGTLLAVLTLTERVWPPLAVYGLVVVAMTLGADGIVGVKARYLAVAFALLVPPAVALARARRSTAVAVLAVYAVVGVWYGTHMLAVGGLTV